MQFLRPALHLAVFALAVAAAIAIAVAGWRAQLILTLLTVPLLLGLGQASLQRQRLERMHHAAHVRADLRYAQVAAEQVALVSLLCGQQLAAAANAHAQAHAHAHGHTSAAADMCMAMAKGVAVAQRRQGSAAGELINELGRLLLPEQIAQLIMGAGAGER